MRTFQLALLILLPLAASERGLGGEVSADQKATIQFIEGLRDKETGAFKNTAKDKPSLRATNGAVKALKTLGQKVADIEKIQKFVLGCYNPKKYGFAEPGGELDAITNSIGIIVACEVGIDKEKIGRAPIYLGVTVVKFEEVRLAAAAIEAWGLKEWPEKIDALKSAVLNFEKGEFPFEKKLTGVGVTGGIAVSKLRFGMDINKGDKTALLEKVLVPSQGKDGGWSKDDATVSDIESTYRVMRALKMLDAKPKDIPQLRKFIASHHNKDGGSAIKPGDPSTISGTYYSVIVSKWLDDMEK